MQIQTVMAKRKQAPTSAHIQGIAVSLSLCAATLGFGGVARAQQTPPVPQYSLPWALRPAIASSVVRSDTALAFYDGGKTVASTFLAGYAFAPKTAGIYARGAWVHASPDQGSGASGFSNPLLFGLFTPKVGESLRFAVFAGAALPLGQGGGNSPDPATKAAVASGVPARSSMDNALFAVNDIVPTAGVGLAYVEQGLTLQVEATVLQLFRAKGDQVQKDSSKTNFTSGLHAGYFLTDMLSMGAELRYQRWLSTPSFVKSELGNRDQMSFAVGPRFNVAVGDGVVMRPGAAFSVPIDDPMKSGGYKMVQVDVPVVF